MFITNNHALFHLWWKQNLVKHQKSQNIMTKVVTTIAVEILGSHDEKGKSKQITTHL